MQVSLNSINCVLLVVYVFIAVPLWSGYVHPSSGESRSFIKRHVATLHRQSVSRAQLRTINLLMPPSYGVLTGFSVAANGLDPQSLNDYIAYYKSLSEFLPAPYLADAYALLGFCSYHQNKTEEALKHYTRSIEINPAFAWTYYNLALVHFRKGNYEEVARLVVQMMALNPETSAQILATSKIYSDLLRERQGFDLSKELLRTYSDALRILMISQYRLGNFPEILNTAQYAVRSGFQPREVFEYYAALAAGNETDRLRADKMMSANPDDPKFKVLTGQDLAARFF